MSVLRRECRYPTSNQGRWASHHSRGHPSSFSLSRIPSCLLYLWPCARADLPVRPACCLVTANVMLGGHRVRALIGHQLVWGFDRVINRQVIAGRTSIDAVPIGTDRRHGSEQNRRRPPTEMNDGWLNMSRSTWRIAIALQSPLRRSEKLWFVSWIDDSRMIDRQPPVDVATWWAWCECYRDLIDRCIVGNEYPVLDDSSITVVDWCVDLTVNTTETMTKTFQNTLNWFIILRLMCRISD